LKKYKKVEQIKIENSGMSNVKFFEKKNHRKPKVFYAYVDHHRVYTGP